MQKCNKSLVFTTLITLLSSICFYAQNLIVNGDFGVFNAAVLNPAPLGYTTTYTQIPYNGSAAYGVYSITNNPQPLAPAYLFSTFDISEGIEGDGTGNMMYVDGKVNQVFWKQDPPLLLDAGKTYTFTYWVRNANTTATIGLPNPAATIKFNPGCTSCVSYTYNSGIDKNWRAVTYQFTPTVTELVSIELSTVNAITNANNFVIDDISLTPPILPLSVSFSKINPTCPSNPDGSIVVYRNSGIPPFKYNLTGSKTDSNDSGVFTGLGPGSYDVTVTDSSPTPQIRSTATITLVAPSDMTLASSAVGCIAPSSSVTLTAANGGGTYNWSASTGVAIPSTASSVNVTPAVNTTYTVTSSRAIPNTNLITNGDFESGTSGFFSDYVYTVASASLTQFDYGITTNPNSWDASFISSTDRSGTGKMLVAKGATATNKTIWSQTVPVDNNKTYTFEFYVQNSVAVSPAQFKVLINGAQIVVFPLSATNAGSPGWTKISGTWNSGINTTAKIQIIDTNIALAGNDFAIDDISFSTVATPKNCSLTKTVQAKVSLTTNFASIPAFCSGSVAPILSTTSPNGIVGTWSPATISNTANGLYTFTPDSTLDACAVGQAPLLTTVTPTTNAGTLSGTQNICIGLTSTFSSTVAGGAWSSSNNAIATVNSSTGVVTGVSVGTATMTYTITGTGGCSNDSKTRTVTVTAPPTAATLSGTQNVCVGLTTTFSSSISGGTWSSSDTSIATVNSASGVVTGVSGGTATITYTITGTGGCANVPSTRNAIVTAAPDAGTLSGTQNICVGLTTTFTSTVTGGTWSSSDTSIATVNSATGVVTGVASGTATINYEVLGICVNANVTRTITVTAAPVAGTLSGIQSICIGLTTTFSSTTLGGTWSSSDVSVATIDSSTGLITGVGAGVATMTYNVTGKGGCSDVSDIRTVTVTAAPNAGTLDGIQEICAALTTTFTTDSLESGVWSSSDALIATVDSSTGVVTGVGAGTATITYTVAGTGGCLDAKATRTVTVTAAPVAGTLSGTQSICVGLTTTFSSTTLGGTWSSSDVSVATIDSSTGLITGVGAGVATMTYNVTGTGGCSDVSDIRTVTVTAAPNAGTLDGIQEICAALTTTFTTDSLESGVWSSSDALIATVDSSTGVVTGVGAGTATITYTVAGTGGCLDAKATRTVTVTAAPVAGTLSGTQSICVGLTTTFSSTTLGGTWSSSDVSVATIDSSTGLITGVGAGVATMTYNVTGTGGCSDVSDIRTVTVTAAPNAGTLDGIQEICAALTTTFTTDSLESGVWSSSDALIATVDSSTGVVTGVGAGTATITYTVAGTGGCLDAKATRTVTVTAAPVAGTLSGTQSICVGLTTTFSSTTLGGNWSSSDVSVATIDSSTGLITGVGAGVATMTYNVTGTGGCSDVSDIRTVTVTAAPNAGTLDGIQEICAALTTTFTTDSLESGVWSSSDALIATVDSSTGVVTGVGAGTATITYTVAGTGGCLDAKATRTVTVTAAPVAGTLSGIQSICVGLTTTFSSTTLGGNWSSSDVSVATIDSSTGLITGVGAGVATMTYNVTGTGGCSDVSDIRTVTVTAAPNAGTLDGIQEICAALTTTFTTDSLESGVWSSSDALIATVDSSTGVVTGVGAGTATITYTVAGTGGCLDAKATRTVTVTAAPVAGTLSGIQSICVGLTTTFSSTTLGGNWSSSDVSVATIDSSTGLITGVGAGTASMVYTVVGNGGCSNVSDALAITVNANDTPLFTSVPPVCYGATISALPTKSENEITGTWSPTLNNTKTTIYTFNPTPGICAVPNTLEIVVLPLPIITATPSLKEICSNTSPNIELKSDISGTTFDWTVVQTNITGATNSSGDSIDQTLSAVSNDKGEALYTITPTANGCKGASITAKIVVNPIPTVSTTSVEPICSGSTTNISLTGTVVGTTFSWNAVSNKVLGAFSSTGNKIAQTLKTATNVQGSVDYSILPLSNGCIGSPTLVMVVVNPVPEVFGSSKTTICSGDSTNIILSPSIVGTQFDWTVSEDGVTGASLGTGDLIQQTLVAGKTSGSATYTITPTVGGCSGTSIKIKINVNPSPMPEIEDGIICVTSDTGETLKSYLLDTQLSNSTYDFRWYFDNEEIVGASQNKYEATDTGVYSVIVTNTITSCVSDEKKVTVIPNYPADSFTVAVSDAFTQNATITVAVQGGTGPYFYQLDNGLAQASTVFTNVSSGEHTITVTDEQGCTSESQKITIIDYPKYFTPNGDGYNDRWNIGGLTNTNIDIYDRYGKLIKQINTSSLGWDGTFNGQLLPATDYWFTVEYIEPNTNATKIFKSHFSLKR